MASKDVRKKAARKRAAVKAQERTRRTMRTPGKVAESGVGLGNVARGVARVVGSAAKGRAAAGRPAANAGSRAAAKRTPGKRTARTPQWAKSYGSKKPSEVTIKMSPKDKVQTQRLQQLVKKKQAAKKTKTQRNVAVGAAAGAGAAGATAGSVNRLANRRKKGKMPIRPKKK